MEFQRSLRVLSAGALVLGCVGVAGADYYSHPELRPQTRCRDIPPGIGSADDPGGVGSLHCQRLFWDLPAVTVIGTRVVSAPFAEDPVPRFPRGLTDRIPPMYVGTVGGRDEGFERLSDCRANAPDCRPLCANPLEVPYWKELLNADGTPVVGTDAFGYTGVDPSTNRSTNRPQSGPLFELACQRGVRSYYGPWQTGGTVNLADCLAEPDHSTNAVAGKCQGPVFDRLAGNQPIRFESTALLDDDVRTSGTPIDQRLEWNTGTEYYNHFASHHGTCYQCTDACCDANNPKPREAYDETNPNAQCYKYEKASAPGSNCYAADEDPSSCASGDPGRVGSAGFRDATQVPGRLSVPLPGSRGVLETEDIVFLCNHHVVTQLPPGSYSMTRLANYRLQTHGLVNTKNHPIYGVAPGQEIGGSVGEMIIQYFARPLKSPVKPLDIVFNAAADLATTYYPPFTWNYHQSQWTPPFDSEVALAAIHSHHRMVKGTMDVLPENPPRPNDKDPVCGGPQADGSPAHLYTDWYWEDAPVCQYWKQADGPVPLRKGETMSTVCYVNNGITPEAIKHGLVAAATVQSLKAMAAPIPDYPDLVPASTWGDPLQKSAVGQELLYGTHPPINYRVVYKCSTVAPNVPGSTVAVGPAGIGYHVCSPNPAVDADGDYVDGAYVNQNQCDGGLCQPGSITFACIGEDEMCIGVNMYWRMDGLVNGDGSVNQDALQKVQKGEVDHVGTPGNYGVATDVSGICPECKSGPGL